MTKLHVSNFILKLSCALLIQNRELSINEIKAFPYVDDEIAEIIKQALLKIFNSYLYQRKIPDSRIPQWEEVIILKE